MTPRSVMVIAGEPSGDLLAAELVQALRAQLRANQTAHRSPHFYGVGGTHLAAAGVELAFDMTQHAVVGLIEVLRNYRKFKRLFDQLLQLALHRRPDLILCVDFGGFNRRFARQVRWEIRVRPFQDWQPKIVQYVSPQVWASRPGRARAMARDFDLLLAIFPFEKQWYAQRVPQLRVEFVGHPMLDRHGHESESERPCQPSDKGRAQTNLVLLLPGSRAGELARHLPVLLEAWKQIQAEQPATLVRMVLPSEPMAALAKRICGNADIPIQVGQLAEALRQTTVAVASTGTVTMECAYFRVPTVALYKTSWSTYQIGKRIIQVKYLAMPNLLADEPLFPELIQHEANPARLARAVLDLLTDPARRQSVQQKLGALLDSLGGPGASTRAAKAILNL